MKPNLKVGIVLAIFFISYVLFINILNTSDFDSDEARHTIQGMAFSSYISYVADNGYISYRSFVDEKLTLRYPQSGYAAIYDPPLHAMTQMGAFMIFGASLAVARLSTQLLIALLLIFAFLMFDKVLSNKIQSTAATILFFALPYTFTLSRQNMLAIPVALLTCGWYYFTFLREGKITNKEVAIRIIGGGACLSAAAMMMYQTLVYIPIFMVVYTLIDLYLKRKKMFEAFGHSTVFFMLAQSMICAGLMLVWFSISFTDSIIPELLLRAGTQEVKGGAIGTLNYFLSFFSQLLDGTMFLAVIGLVALVNRKFTKKHWPMLLFVAVTLLSATFVLSNRQLRYITHIIPFVTLFVVVGLVHISRKLQWKKSSLLGLLTLIVVGLFAFNLYGANVYSQEQGVQTLAYSWFDQQPSPRTIVNLEIEGQREPLAYMHTPDTVIANLMTIDSAGQSATYIKINEVRSLAVVIDQIADSNLYVMVLDTMLKTETGLKVHDFFVDNGFKITKIHPYTIYHHSTKNPPAIEFTSLAKSKEALSLINEGQDYFEKRSFAKAAIKLEQAVKLEPFHIRLRIGLATTYATMAIDLLDRGKPELAKQALEKSIRIYPWILDEFKGTKINDRLSDLLEKKEANKNGVPVRDIDVMGPVNTSVSVIKSA